MAFTVVRGDLDLLCASERASSWRERIDRGIGSGAASPDWCFTLTSSDGGERVAAAGFRAFWPGAEPGLLAWLDLGCDPADSAEAGEPAAELLRRALAELPAALSIHDIELPPGQHPAQARPAEHRAVTGAGYVMEVERTAQWWTVADGVPAQSGRLAFRPMAELGPDGLDSLLRRIALGSLDHDTRTKLAEPGGLDADVAETASHLLDHTAKHPDWFEAAYADGEPVGLIAASEWRSPDGPMGEIAYIGVVEGRRGKGYVDDLLARGMASIASGGLAKADAGTDVGNGPMRAAFARAGWTVSEHTFRYYWRRPS